ncbi:MAG: DNA repair protein RadC [Chloroflexi bacterium]|nr:DNA repair protein RadC [Chloroflexota bacterium]
MLRDGAASLADDELLALLIASGRPGRDARRMAHDLLVSLGGLRALGRADGSQLAALGPATRARVLAAAELGRRMVSADADAEPLDTPEAAARALAPRLAHLEREAVVVALLDRKQRLIAVTGLYRGNVSGTSVRIGELFSEAVRRNAAGVLLAHNHPSGDPEPSADDVRTTREAVAAGRLLGIPVVDHLVIGAGGRWVSLKRRGQLGG